MIPQILEKNFPNYATLSSATVTLADMGERTISAQVKIDGGIRPDFSYDWEVLHDGHKYIMPLREPQASKGNTTKNTEIELTFRHWAEYELKRWPFVTMQPIEAGVAVADDEVATVCLNLGDFCELFSQVLKYYYGDKITIRLNPDREYASEPSTVSIDHTSVWDVLTKTFYDIFGARWRIEPAINDSSKYVIEIGYPTEEQTHIFEYGYEGGLLKVERQVQSEDISNMLKGRGGENNVPYRYYKDVDTANPSFPADPDWVRELANVPMTRLRGATFRSYVQGWKAAHKEDYPGYEAIAAEAAYAPWAYHKGYKDKKFQPVEFVADEIVGNAVGDVREIELLPGYIAEIQEGSSLDKYGPLPSSLDDNDDIYPTLQGVEVKPYGRIDEVVAVEEITSDDITESAESDARLATMAGISSGWYLMGPHERRTYTLTGNLEVEKGKTANFLVDLTASGRAIIESYAIELTDVAEDEVVSAAGIPEGYYRYEIRAEVYNPEDESRHVAVSCACPRLEDATLHDKWGNTWRIWVKNLWGTSKRDDETDEAYAERVWGPILGDREGNQAKVVFSTGALSASEDYEFTIVKIPKYEKKTCTWQTVANDKIVEHEYESEWCVELGKSDADLETLGEYVPSTKRQAVAGDFFFLVGIDMPHLYIKWAEERLDDWKKDNLEAKKEIKPTWLVQTDRVRMSDHGSVEALIRKLHPGDTIRLADERFIEGAYETLTLATLTITYREATNDDAALNPDVEMTLGEDYHGGGDVIGTLQGEVSALSKQVGSISNIEQVVRAIGNKLYLRKDGMPERSVSPTEFASLLTSKGFRSGMIGGAGWGMYKDENGHWVLETDRLKAREDFEVNTLVVNQVTGQGGTIVESAAAIEVSRVERVGAGYKCYFDQHEGTVGNLFRVDDVAWNNRYTPENQRAKTYKRRVIGTGVDYIVLSDKDCAGDGIPEAGDAIVQYGNYSDKNRQYVKVRDVIGGGYERFIEGLDSVKATGTEYYFVGRQAGMYNGRPRWYIGDSNGYIEWVDGELHIKGKIELASTYGDKTLGGYIDDAAQGATAAAKEELEHKIDALQAQVDGVIESWSGHGEPTAANYPANQWATDEERRRHDRDIYTDITPYVDAATTPTSGHSWKWYYNTASDYGWNKISDSEAVKALELARASVIKVDTLFIRTDYATVKPSLPTVSAITGAITNANGWATDAPAWVDGKYIWQTTYTRYGDGAVVFSGPTCLTGATGAAGTSITIVDKSVTYSTNTGATQPSDSTFTLTSVPAVSAGQYLWSRTYVKYSNGESTTSYAVSRTGADGAAGASYNPNLLKNKYLIGANHGILIDCGVELTTKPADTYFYVYLDDGVVISELRNQKVTFSCMCEGLPDGERYVFGINGQSNTYIYINKNGLNTTVLTISDSISDCDDSRILLDDVARPLVYDAKVRITHCCLTIGDNPTQKYVPAASEMLAPTITATTVTYAKTTTSAQPADGAFVYGTIGAADVALGEYLWTKTEVAYSDGSSTKSYTVGRIGSDGEDGKPGKPGVDGESSYVHYAYANSADGATSFSTTYFAGALYVGVCIDNNSADPTTYASYEWARLKGEDGRGIAAVVEEYAVHNSGTTAPADGAFSAGVKEMTDANAYLWNREKTTYSDNTVETAAAVCIGVKGQNGADGATVVSVTNYYLAWESASGVTTSTAGWTADAASAKTSADKPYLWNYEVTKWSKGANTATAPHVIGTFGSGYTENLLTESNDVKETSAYRVAIYPLSEAPVSGEAYTMTIWGELASTKEAFSIYNSGGSVDMTRLERVGEGVYSKVFRWRNVTVQGWTADDTSVYVYQAPSTAAGVSKIVKAKLERGANANPQWTPNSKEQLAPTLTEQYYLSTSNTALSGGEWQDTSPTWVAGKYIWTRTKITSGTGAVTYTDAVCATGERGMAGADAYRLDLTDETIPIACTSDGKVAGPYKISEARVYRGGTRITAGVRFGIVQATGVQAGISPVGVIEPYGLMADRGEIVVGATVDGMEFTTTLTLYKVRAGAAGAAATVYELELSEDAIVRTPYGMLSAGEITIWKYRTTGSTARELTTEKTVRYRRIGVDAEWQAATGATSSYTVAVPNDGMLESIEVELMDGDKVLDRETIPVIESGTKASENLVRYSDEEVETSEYMMRQYMLSEVLEQGATYTFTIWGTLAPNKRYALWNSLGNSQMIGTLSEIAAGVYTAVLTVPINSYPHIDWSRLNVYAYPMGVTGVSTIERIKVEKGANRAPYWSKSSLDTDYVTRALKESGSSEGGLILSSLMRMGYTEQGGSYKVMAGLNGIAEESGALALWCGGEMLDRALTNAERAALSAMRHDGTAYFAGNTIRMQRAMMQVGDNVQLDDTGLSLIVGDNTALHIGDSEIDDTQGASNLSAELGGKTLLSPTSYYDTEYGSTFPVGEGAAVALYGAAVPVGTIMTGEVSIRAPYMSGASTDIIMEILVDGAAVATYQYILQRGGDGLAGTYAIGGLRMPKSGVVSARLRWPNEAKANWDESGYSNPYESATLTFVSGNLSHGTGNQTTIGRNGLMAVWGTSTFLCNKDMVVMRCGGYGLRVSAAGIEKMVGGVWKEL